MTSKSYKEEVEKILNNQKYRTKLMEEIRIAYRQYMRNQTEERETKLQLLITMYWNKQAIKTMKERYK